MGVSNAQAVFGEANQLSRQNVRSCKRQAAERDALSHHGSLHQRIRIGKGGAGDIAIELVELAALGESRVITRTVTNSDGRTDAPLIGGRPVPIGRYELRFSVGKYFAARGVPMSDPPFLDGGRVARDAALAPEPGKFPLILPSHGTGGTTGNMAWLGEALAAHQYFESEQKNAGERRGGLPEPGLRS